MVRDANFEDTEQTEANSKRFDGDQHPFAMPKIERAAANSPSYDDLGSSWKSAASASSPQQQAALFAKLNNDLADKAASMLSSNKGAEAVAEIQKQLNSRLSDAPGGPLLSYDQTKNSLLILHLREASEKENLQIASKLATGRLNEDQLAELGFLSAKSSDGTVTYYAPIVDPQTIDLSSRLAKGKSTADAPSKLPAQNSEPGSPVSRPPDHIVIVMEENHSYEQLIGNPDAPFINSLAANGRLFTNAHAVAHPSLPNYLALFSGSTQGVKDDERHTFPGVPTLATQLKEAGKSFTGFVDDGSPQEHNPWESFPNSKDTGKNMSEFPKDFNKLPTVSIVSPNYMHDMHDGTIRQADDWLKQNLGAYAEWAKDHNSLLIVMTDEDDDDQGNHIPVIEYGAGIKPSKNSEPIDTIGILHGIEERLGLPFLGKKSTPAPLAPD